MLMNWKIFGNMNRYIYGMMILLALPLSIVGCQEEYVTYSDAEYVMFADTLATYPVMQDQQAFSVPVVSTVVRDYDRTFGVEVIDAADGAVENLHFSLESNTVVIKAGENRADVRVYGKYDNLNPEKPLAMTLNLLVPEQVQMPLYGTRTKAVMQKVCPFDIHDFEGWCVFSSMFLYQYNLTGSYQRLVKTKVLDENTILCRNWMRDGYDIKMVFHPEEPLNQYVTIPEGQVASDEHSFFGIVYGDDNILVRTSSLYDSYFYTFGKYLFVYAEMYVETLGETFGSVGHFYNVMEWVSEAEARRLFYESGMPGYYNE